MKLIGLIAYLTIFSTFAYASEFNIDLMSLIQDKPWAQNNIALHIEETYSQLLRKNKIKVMKPSNELNNLFCYRKKVGTIRGRKRVRKKCSKVTGFYSIDTDNIYVDEDHKLYISNLLHEVIHAYQYRVRFPWDVTLLYEALKQNKLKEKDFFDYLSYYYENQANWYAATLELNKYWNKVLERERTRNSYITATTALALFAINPLAAVGYMMLPNSNRTQLNPQIYLRENNSVIPNIDIKALIAEKKNRYFTSPYRFSELIVQEPPKDMNIALGNTFKAYAKSIEKSYFGNLEFLFDFKAQDQKLFTSLHNQYYDNISLLSGVGCNKILEFIDSGQSPKNQWLKITKEQLNKCDAFKSVSLEALQFYKKLSSNQGSSPFRIPRSHITDSLDNNDDAIIQPGSEGSKPSLPIQPGSEGSKPSLPIQPGSEGSKPSLPIQPGSEGSKPSLPIQPGSEGSKPSILIQPQLEIRP